MDNIWTKTLVLEPMDLSRSPPKKAKSLSSTINLDNINSKALNKTRVYSNRLMLKLFKTSTPKLLPLFPALALMPLKMSEEENTRTNT